MAKKAPLALGGGVWGWFRILRVYRVFEVWLRVEGFGFQGLVLKAESLGCSCSKGPLEGGTIGNIPPCKEIQANREATVWL